MGASIDLVAARAASQEAVDEYRNSLDETGSALADDVRLFADFIQVHARHLGPDDVVALDVYRSGFKLHLTGNGHAAANLLFAATALSDVTVWLALSGGNVHVNMTGTYCGRTINLVSIATGLEASLLADEVDWPQGRHPEISVDRLRTFAAEAVTS